MYNIEGKDIPMYPEKQFNCLNCDLQRDHQTLNYFRASIHELYPTQKVPLTDFGALL